MQRKIYLTFFASFLFSAISIAQENKEGDNQFNFYGFGRTLFVWDDQNLGRSDLFVPANIEVGEPKQPEFFIGAKQSRIGFESKLSVGTEVLTIKLEGDFHNDTSDATGLFRMRLAYAEYKYVLVGMNWSNFFDEQVNPNTVDFEGPNSSTLSRTPQIKFSTYKSKNVLSISFENPIEKVTVSEPITALPERMPDIIGAYRFNDKFGFIKAAALIREIRYESDKARSLIGYGATIMSSINVGKKDKLKIQGVMGTGIAQYIQGANGLNYDAIYNGTNELETLQMYGTNVSYQHFWKDHLYSSLTSGFLSVEDNDNLKPSDYKMGYYASLNLFYDVVKNLSFGWEIVTGERINVNDESSSAIRFQMNATYKFNKSFK
jgi:DcaP outer membrane protein